MSSDVEVTLVVVGKNRKVRKQLGEELWSNSKCEKLKLKSILVHRHYPVIKKVKKKFNAVKTCIYITLIITN